jgi:hypothetical protein
MKTLYLFRSNLRHLEYYHKYKTLKEFEKNCHDFYLLFPLELLKMGKYDKVIIWRLTNTPKEDIVFKFKNEIGSKGIFIQKFCVRSFDEAFALPRPDVSIFRGGFKEYDSVVNKIPGFFGKTFYLGASRRLTPAYGGKYDFVLYESELDLPSGNSNDIKFKRFFKTANPKIFYPIETKPEFDMIWPWKYTTDHRKGEKFFLKAISEHPGLQQLKIYHCGNEVKKAKKLFAAYGVKNIICDDIKHYHDMNEVINNGICGLLTSDKEDGCPRLSTEILSCGVPLLIRNTTRILNYYNGSGKIDYINNNNLYSKFLFIKENRATIVEKLKVRLQKDLSIRNICQMNIDEWGI